jgi:hypothetical protein
MVSSYPIKTVSMKEIIMEQYTVKDRINNHVNVETAKVSYSLDGKENVITAQDFLNQYGNRKIGKLDEIYNEDGSYTSGNTIHCFF